MRSFVRILSTLAVCLMVWGGAAPAQAASSPLRFGAAWYPEQWPESRWDRDLDLMKAAHINVVRIAEFSWSRMEPSEGRYDFGWLDRAVAAAARHHIKVVLGTPTAAPPAWLTQKYPDVLRVNEDGRREEHGNRLQYNFSSPRYRAFARTIAEKMAARYGRNPDVIGWQIDNEIAPVSFDAGTKAKFQDWLKARYKTLGALNAAWTTEYWSESYTDWRQIPFHSKGENPGLLLAFKYFVTDMWTDYVGNQLRVIRARVDPRQFVTTNTMHWNAAFDHYVLHRDLDLAAWDNYLPDGHFVWTDNAVQHDLVRGYKRRNFWVMETQAGYVNYGPLNRTLDRGVMREMAWQAVGHGADALLYWQWRSALNGQEQYYGVLVGPDGEPVPVYREAQQIGAEFAKASRALAGTAPKAKVAMLFSYASRWAIDFQRHSKDFDPVREFDAFYRPLAHQAQTVDVISADAPLSAYKLVIAPALNVLTKAEAGRLAAYVRAGGHLVLGPRSGMKTKDNTLWQVRQPGPLAKLLGAHVEQYYALDAPAELSGKTGGGTAKVWAEALKTDRDDARVLMRYGKSADWFSDQPAIVTRSVGKGTVTYVGFWPDDALMARLAAGFLEQAKVSPVLAGAPDTVEVCERVGSGKRVLILINHGDTEQTLELPARGRDLLTNRAVHGKIRLAAHDVAVVALKGASAQ